MRLIKIRRKFYRAHFRFFLFLFLTIFSIYFYWEDFVEAYRNLTIKKQCRPWYFQGGILRPIQFRPDLKLWPEETDDHRILEQLMFIPKRKPTVIKKIYVEKMKAFKVKPGSKIFRTLNCPVNDCEIITKESEADAVVFLDNITKDRNSSTSHQLWILYMLESPFYVGKVLNHESVNWTASYRFDSDLVTPYDVWVYYDETNKSMVPKNYSEGKTKQVAWFVSNCRSKNKRRDYAEELAKYIPVDIYGRCGNKVCRKKNAAKCRKKVSREYKFYLSFENANCRDYITEKFYLNGLQSDVIPIVMGPPKEDYEKVAPENSFIHVEDFESPQHLAEYLNYLDQNNNSYNAYFKWKGTGEFINTYFMCRLCGMLHAGRPPHYYKDFTDWWKKPQICTKTFWRKESENRRFLENGKPKKKRRN